MGTRLAVVITEAPLEKAQFAFEEIVSELSRLEGKLSFFSEQSLLSKINKEACKQTVAIDTEMANIISICLDYHTKTNGAFDITVSSEDSSAASINDVILDTNDLLIRFKKPGIKLDLGGFGKGYALGRIRRILNEQGIKNALISFGESSILGLGTHPFGNCWKVGVQNIYSQDEAAYVFELKNQVLSTSGLAGTSTQPQMYGHIYNPAAKKLVENNSTISVKSNNCLDPEVLSTALFASISGEGSFLSNFPDCRAVKIDYNGEHLSRIINYE